MSCCNHTHDNTKKSALDSKIPYGVLCGKLVIAPAIPGPCLTAYCTLYSSTALFASPTCSPIIFNCLITQDFDHIYGHVLPRGQIIYPFNHPSSNAELQAIHPEGILTANHTISAEAISVLYANNTVRLIWPATDQAAAEMAMQCWKKYGTRIQNVHMTMTLGSFGMLEHPELEDPGAIVVFGPAGEAWHWLNAALQAATLNSLQTLKVTMQDDWLWYSAPLLAEFSKRALFSMLRGLVRNLAVQKVTLQSRCGGCIDTIWREAMLSRRGVAEGEEGGMVRHLIVQADDSILPTIGEVNMFLCDLWDVLQNEVHDGAA